MKKNSAILVMVIGVILLAIGLFLKTPGTELTTYSSLEGVKNYSVIDEYVGGDAYNYIIGASLIAGELSGILTMKAIFIAVGVLIFCIGLISLSWVKEKQVIASSENIDVNTIEPEKFNYTSSDNVDMNKE